MNRQQLIDSMTKRVLFAGLKQTQLESIAELIERQHYGPDELIFDANEYGDSLYVVESGQVEVSLQNSRDGDPKNVVLMDIEGQADGSRCPYGDFFGEMCLLDLEPRSARVVTRSQTTVWEINRDHLYWLFGDDKHLQLHILLTIARVLSRRLGTLNVNTEGPGEALKSKPGKP